MDSHIYNVKSGLSALIVEETGRHITVHIFTDGLGDVEVRPIVNADLTYDYPDTNQVTIIIGNEWVSIP